MKHTIKIILQIVISVLIAMEVSIPPNDYIHYLIASLILYICVKNNIDDKMDTSIENDSQNIEDDIEKENKDS